MLCMRDQRKEHRVNILARAEVLWVDSAGISRAVQATLEDTSRNGACLRTKEPIGVGSKITIKWRREEFTGTVRHSQKVASDYILGIRRDTEKLVWRP
jgi:hypothetical protein